MNTGVTAPNPNNDATSLTLEERIEKLEQSMEQLERFFDRLVDMQRFLDRFVDILHITLK